MTVAKQIGRFIIQRHPERTDYLHPVWRVYDGDDLIVTCSYLKGAEELIQRLMEYEAIINRLRASGYKLGA